MKIEKRLANLFCASIAAVGSFVVAGCSTGPAYPTITELQNKTGKKVIEIPADGSNLDQMGAYCMAVGSTKQKGLWGRNPHDSKCNTGKSADLNKLAYGQSEIDDICEEAGGHLDFVRKPNTVGFDAKDLIDVCVTNISS